jgi:predicted enzyme related to lactoylglutathione lyase
LSDFNKLAAGSSPIVKLEGSVSMNVMSIAAVTITSNDPERLATFYRARLGIPLESASHGPMQRHFEGWLGEPARGGVHFAVLKGAARSGAAPTFRVYGIDGCLAELQAGGLEAKHRIAELGEGKRLVSFRDCDGNMFRLIDLGF